jgi:hypothetical protein
MQHSKPSRVELARARAFVESVRWTFAASLPQHPHWWALRDRFDDAGRGEFDWFLSLVGKHGYEGTFWHQRWVYLDIDDFKYWPSKAWFGVGPMLNRARLPEPE